jgi:5-methylcytosine-specific restriction endonuclease McrA
MEWIQKLLGIGDYSPERLCGATRSPQWPGVRATHLASNPTCIVCGGTGGLQVHHVRPFHIHPELELDPTNLVTVCTTNGTLNCHVRFGHLDNFRLKWNPNIREDAALWLARFNAQTEQEVFPAEIETAV